MGWEGLFIFYLEAILKLRYPPRYNRAVAINLESTEPLLVRLIEEIGKLPAGFTYELPRFEAERLIARRAAIAVGNLGVIPDISLSEQECAEAGL